MKCIICNSEIESYPCPVCGYTGKNNEDPHYLNPGTVLFSGRYKVGHVVGAGGFGVTYAAWDTELMRRVAIKEYMPGEFSTRMKGCTALTVYGGEKKQQFESGMLKFHDESERLAKFTEVPGIVQIYDCFYENNTAYIVTELLQGETLDERIKREGKIPVSEAIDIMIPILDALTEVHKESIIHRDIAPNNIYLTSDGKVKLLDFGAARTATGSHSKSLTVLYKEGFTAEEQYQSNGTQGPWTDVYSAAATLYKAITGETPDGALERRLKDKLIPPSKCGIEISKNVNTAILNALNVNYKIRTQSTEAFKKELTGTGGVKKRYQRTIERKIGRIPKRVWITSLVLMAAIVTMVVLQATGVIHFDTKMFDSLFNSSGRMINIVNMDVEEARSKVESLGLEFEIEEVYSNDYLPDKIISQTPENRALIEDTVVKVRVSRESRQVDIPDLSGLTYEEAETILNEKHLICEKVEQESSFKPNIVMGTSPDSNGKQWQGQPVKVTVSSGMKTAGKGDYTVESMLERPISEARDFLTGEGIYLEIDGKEEDMIVPQGSILFQDKEPGTVITAGSEMKVTVSSGIDVKARANADKSAEALLKKYFVESAVRSGRHDQILEEVAKKAARGDEISKGVVLFNEIRVESGLDPVYPSADLNGAASEMAQLIASGAIDSNWRDAGSDQYSRLRGIYSKYHVSPEGFHVGRSYIESGVSEITSGADSHRKEYNNPDALYMGVGRARSASGSYWYVFLFSD